MLGEGVIATLLALVLGMLTAALVYTAKQDVEVVERHLEVSGLLGRAFAVGAFFSAVLETSRPQRLLSLCAGGAVFCFAYHYACRFAFYMRRR